jgi:hypothetical protein
VGEPQRDQSHAHEDISVWYDVAQGRETRHRADAHEGQYDRPQAAEPGPDGRENGGDPEDPSFHDSSFIFTRDGHRRRSGQRPPRTSAPKLNASARMTPAPGVSG